MLHNTFTDQFSTNHNWLELQYAKHSRIKIYIRSIINTQFLRIWASEQMCIVHFKNKSLRKLIFYFEKFQTTTNKDKKIVPHSANKLNSVKKPQKTPNKNPTSNYVRNKSGLVLNFLLCSTS